MASVGVRVVGDRRAHFGCWIVEGSTHGPREAYDHLRVEPVDRVHGSCRGRGRPRSRLVGEERSSSAACRFGAERTYTTAPFSSRRSRSCVGLPPESQSSPAADSAPGPAGGRPRACRPSPSAACWLTRRRRRHCWTTAVAAVPSRSATPVDRCTNAAGIGSAAAPAAAPIPTRASQLLAPGVGTVGHPAAGALLKMIAPLAPAAFATDSFW
jgi:hypothetical protein